VSQIKARLIESALLKKGFKKFDHGKDHRFYFYIYNGAKTSVFTKMSHGDTEIGDQLLAMMAKQLRFRQRSEFVDLVSCAVSQEQYLQLLLAGKHIVG